MTAKSFSLPQIAARGLIVCGLLAPAVLASPALAKPLLDTPVYNEETKSYFALKSSPVGISGWDQLATYSATSYFKDIPGRLAKVKSRSVEDFLISTFQPSANAWIGLRFFCRYRKLVWVDGETHPFDGYKNWLTPWYRTYINCDQVRDLDWMPVYLTSNLDGPRWQASGPHKGWTLYFVEYPTGKP